MKNHPTATLLAKLNKSVFFILIIIGTVLVSSTAFGQTPGVIFKKASGNVLDPNGDGYVSISPNGFVVNDQTESEIPYRPIVVPSVEPVADPGPGPNCGFTDIVDSGSEDPVFTYVDANGNFLFRFRLGNAADNSKGYSMMIDTDQKFGFSGIDADPNAVPGNPGFEIEIVLESNFGVSLYNVDGTTTPVKQGATLPFDTYAQKSVALTTNCGTPDYFYDFYIPWSTITNYFPAVNQNTPLRMVAVTTMNPHPAIGNGAVSDAGGIDDSAAGYNYDLIFQTIVNNYTPTPSTGTPLDRTPCPVVNSGINNGATTVTGTSTAIGATIIVYKGTSTLTPISSGTVTVQANGTWSATVSAVAAGEVISATAQASGKGVSSNACSQITVTNCSPPAPPYNLTVGGGRKLIQGTGTVGGTLNVYTLSGGSYVAAGNAIAIPTGGAWCWRSDNTGVSTCTTSGASDLLTTTYYVSQTVNGCESAKVPICVDNSVNISTNPTLTQTSISTTTTSLSGTAGTGSTISIYANNTLITTVAAVGTALSATVNLGSYGGTYIWVQAVQTGKCAAIALSQAVLVTIPTPTSDTPVITGSYCGTAAGSLQSVSGTSTESDGAIITAFINGVNSGTTTVYNGKWSVSLTLKSADKVRVTATGTGENVSALSNEITVGLSGAAPTVAFNALLEGATTVSGTFSGGTTLKIYVDGLLLASTTTSPFSISVGANEIYAGASITATVTSGGCESAESAATVVPCALPLTNLTITPLSVDVCNGSSTTVTITNPQEGIIYQLFNGAASSGASKLGPASGTLMLTSATLTANAVLSIRALKISPVSCTATLTSTHSVTIIPVIASNTITAPSVSTFCQSGDPDVITGSDPTGGNGTYTYQWMSSTDNVSYTNIPGATSKNYDPGTINATTYYKRVVNSGPCTTTTSSPVTLTIQNTTLTNTITAASSTSLTDSGTPSITGNNAGVGITYVWQSSTDNVNWTSTGVVNQNYAPGSTITVTTYYRRVATNGACTSFGNVITFNVNRTPTVTNFTKSGTEDTNVSFSASDFTSVFTDADNNPLVQIRIESLSANGTLLLNGTPLTAGAVILVADLGNLIFSPSANFNGTTTFTWKGYDGSVYSNNTSTVTLNLSAVNDIPTASNFTITTNEDVAYTFALTNFTASYADVENSSLSDVRISVLPSSGALKLNGVDVTANQVIPAASISNLVFTPAADQFGAPYATISYQVSDGTAFSTTYIITVNVTAVNDVPSFTKGADQTVNEDASAQTINGWATAISPGPANENTQTVTFNVSNNNNALFSVQPAISASGVLTYTLAANEFGTATVTVTISDNSGATSTAQTFVIMVNPVNDVPSFTKGADQTVDEDAGAQSVNGWATAISPGPANENTQTVSFNVSNNNNALFTVQPAISSTGVLTFTPAANAFGTATITVTISDNAGGTSASQTFVITVNAVNDTPSFTKGADQTVNEDAGAQTINGWATAISAGPANESTQTVSFNVSNNNNALFSVQPAISSTGVLTYTPAANAFGTSTVTVTVSDNAGGTSASQTFVITVNAVNDIPSFTKGADQTVNEDAGLQTVNAWATAISPGPANENTQTVSFNVSNNNNGLFAVQPAVSSTGILTYTPADDAFGTATITVTISDNVGATSASQTFIITLNAVNDAPSFSAGASQSHLVNAGSITLTNWASSISPGPANESAQTVSFTLSNNNNSLFSVQPTISSSGTLTYTLANAATGIATVSVSITDNGGTANGGVNTSAVQTFTIEVSATPNTAPTAAGKTITITEDGTYTFTSSDFNASYADADGDAFSGIKIVSLPSNGTLRLNGVDVVMNQIIAPANLGSLTFIPAADENGTSYASFNFQVSDGTAYSASYAIMFNVSAVNDTPAFTKGADQTIDEDAGAQTVNGWATAISPGPANENTQTISFNVSNSNNALFSVQPAISASGVLTYTPAANAFGTATVTVTISDNAGGTSTSQTFVITVNSVNDTPSFTKGADQTVDEDAVAQTVNGWATAISSGPVNENTQTVSFNVSNNNNALFSLQPAISSTGVLTYTPAANEFGTATVTVTISDNAGGTSSSQTFVITINPVNDIPSFTKGTDQTIDEDGGVQTINGWATAISPGPANENTQTVSFNVSNNNNALFSVQPAISSTGVLTFTPAADAFGTATVTVTLSDNAGGTSTSQTFVITINSINDTPSFTKGADQTVDEDAGAQTVNGWATAILPGPVNENTQTVSFNVSNNNNGLFSIQPAISPTGVLTYTPAADAFGTATITVTISDDVGASSTSQTFVITINPVNDVPSFAKGSDQIADEDAGTQTLVGWATSISPGPANESTQAVSFNVSNNNNALFSVQPAISPAGILTYTPATDAFGTATITVTISDNGGATSSSQTFIIDINSVNDRPSFTGGPNQTNYATDGLINISNWAYNIAAGPANENSQTISFSVTNDNNGLFSVQPAIAANGTLTYTLAGNATGTAEVTVFLNDNGGTDNGGVDLSLPFLFTITVNPPVPPQVNIDSPVGTEDNAVIVNLLANDVAGTTPIDPASVDLDPSTPGIQNSITTAEGTWTVVNGTLTFTPAPDFNGIATISYTVADMNGLVSNVGAVSVTVNAVNDAPVIGNKNIEVTIDTPFTGSILSVDDKDPDGSPLTVNTTPVSGPAHGTITINPDGTFEYIPNPGFTGTDVVTVQICDAGLPLPGICITRTITIEVIDDSGTPPVVSNATVSLEENVANGTVVFAVLATDADNDDLTYAITAGGNGYFKIDPVTGVITVLDNTGLDYEKNTVFILTITVTDEKGNVTTAQITINIGNTDNEDSDGDNISDVVEKGSAPSSPLDTDNDGVPDFLDRDSDNDGIPDVDETAGDLDNDGIPNYRDDDSDNDGVDDAVESGGSTPSGNDADNDGIDDAFDADQGNAPSVPKDSDGDSIPDYLDPDDDNDGVSTEDEVNHSDNVTDHDDDGIADYLDPDDDNDGELTKDEDRNGDGNFFNDDCDEDSVPDFIDADQCKVNPSKGFSPNGDADNDVWNIVNIEQYPNNKVTIFNRWGNVVFEVKGYNNNDRAWSGQSDGKWLIGSDLKVPDGTYFYSIDLGDGSKAIGGFIVIKR